MEETHHSQPSINLLQKSTFFNSAQQQLIKQIQVQLPQLTQQTKDLNIADWKRKSNKIVKYDDQIGHCLDGGFDENVVGEISVPKMLYRGLNQDLSTVILIDHLKKERCTAVEFRDRMETIAKNLLKLGFKKGDVGAYFVSNSIDTIAFLAACFRVGIVPAGCNNLQRTDELKRQLELCGASLIFTDLPLVMTSVTASRGCPKVKKVILMGGEHPDCVTFKDFFTTNNLPLLPSFDDLDLKSDDVAMVIFSSGTTGVEKAVLLSHRNIQAQFTVSIGENVRKIQNNQVVFASVAHLSGSIITIFGISLGFTTYLLTKFDLNSYLHLLSQNKIRTISLIPVLANQLAKSTDVFKYDLSSLKEIVCGTAPLCREVVDLLIARFPGVCVRQAYGLSECSGMCTMVPGIPLNTSIRQDCHKLGSVGIPLPCVRIKIVCPSGGKVLGPHQQGEILIQSPMVMIGYKDAREGHIAPVAVTSDGWLRSGDLGYFDDDGYLYVVDRLKELIKVRSYQVSPIEIESVLLSHDDVIDAAVFPVPDTSEGAVPAAWVVLRPETKTTHNDLLEYVREKLAPFKHLKGGVDFVDKIPRNHSGKILRKQMKRLN